MTSSANRQESPPWPACALLAAGLLAVTASIRVPTGLYAASREDFSSASTEVLLILLGAAVLLFLVVTLPLVLLPSRVRSLAGAALTGLAIYAWVRAGFFPGPSLDLDGTGVTEDLSTGLAGLLIPLAAGLLLAWMAHRRARVTVVALAILLAGSLVQSGADAVSAWRAGAPASGDPSAGLLEWSRKGNVAIILLDSLQADVFEDVLEAEPHLREELDGFRFYRSATSGSAHTYLSLPTIHSGRQYDSAQPAPRFFQDTIREHSVLTRLADAGYRVGYARSLGPCPRGIADCLSLGELRHSRGEVALREALHLLDLGLYRVSPDGPRRAILAEGKGLLTTVIGQAYLVDRAQGEVAALGRLAESSVVSDGPPTAKMIHTLLTHPPLFLEPDCSTGKEIHRRENAVAQARCAFKLLLPLFDRLKAEGAYDPSDILIVADHGYRFESTAVTATGDVAFRQRVGVMNPIVLVKPAYERGPLTVSDAEVELADLAPALCDDTGCSPAEGLRHLDEVEPGRTREVLQYIWKFRYRGLDKIPGLVGYTVNGKMSDPASWSRETEARYTPGTPINFQRGKQNSKPYIGLGWGLRRPDGHPMQDSSATLLLKVATLDPARDYELALTAGLDRGAPPSPARVTVAVNGERVGDLVTQHVGSMDTYRLRVPGAVLQRRATTEIRFSLPPGEDQSETYFMLQTLELHPLP
jgi:hypothetical protein